MSSSTESLHNVPADHERDDDMQDTDGLTNRNVSADVQEEINKLLDCVPQIDSLFSVIDKIGEGTFSSVYLARLKAYPQIKQMFALKHITPTSHPSRTETELRCLQEIGGVDNVMGVKLCLREKDHVVIVMPYFPHNKFMDYVQDLTPAEVKDYMKNLLIALRRVHEVDIIHRDVKPSNFLYNSKLRQYALVDFGLAHKAPVLLKTQKKPADGANLPNAMKEATSAPTSTLKRKAKRHSVENENEGVPVSPSKRAHLQNDDRKLAEIEINICSQGTPRPPPEITKAKPVINFQKPLKQMPAAEVAKPFSKSCRSPRRMLLTKRAMNNTNQSLFHSGARNLAAAASSRLLSKAGMSAAVMQNSCQCFGMAMVCSVCMSRMNQVAARAGTPGFRSPEVLMKCPDQSTAVDIWSAGVIFLSLLSGRYPFFRANDDLTALAQVISIFGSEHVAKSAHQIGKHLICSPATPPLDLRTMCEKLRGINRSSSPKSKCSASKANMTPQSEWESVPDSAYDVLRKMLALNPHERITAEEALRQPYFCD